MRIPAINGLFPEEKSLVPIPNSFIQGGGYDVGKIDQHRKTVSDAYTEILTLKDIQTEFVIPDASIEDLTFALNEPLNYYDKKMINTVYVPKYNGSIINKDGKYYMIYRYTTYGLENDPFDPDSITHPWRVFFPDYPLYNGEVRSRHYFDVLKYYGVDENLHKHGFPLKYDHTGMAEITIDNSKISVVKDNKYFFYYDHNNYFPMVDTRAYVFDEKAYFTFNYWIHKADIPLNLPNFAKSHGKKQIMDKIKDDNPWVPLIGCYTLDKIDINKDNNKLQKCNDTLSICSPYDKNVGGKNWILFEYNNKKYIIYYLSDNFTVLDYDKCKINDENVIHSDKKVDSISRITKKYKGLHYGLGSSYIKYGDEYIGVAHLKVCYESNKIPQFHSFFTKYIKGKKAVRYLHTTVSPTTNFCYFIFFYTFNPRTFDVMRISNPFIVKNIDDELTYSLQFASGIIEIPDNKFMVTIGEGDVFVKVITFTKDTIDRLLMPIDVYDKNFDFYLFNISIKRQEIVPYNNIHQEYFEKYCHKKKNTYNKNDYIKGIEDNTDLECKKIHYINKYDNKQTISIHEYKSMDDEYKMFQHAYATDYFHIVKPIYIDNKEIVFNDDVPISMYDAFKNIINTNEDFLTVIYQLYFTFAYLHTVCKLIYIPFNAKSMFLYIDPEYCSNKTGYYKYTIKSSSGTKSYYFKINKYIIKINEFGKGIQNIKRPGSVPNYHYKYTFHLLNELIYSQNYDIYKFSAIKTLRDIMLSTGINDNEFKSQRVGYKFLMDEIFSNFTKPQTDIVKEYVLTLNDDNLQ